MSGEMIEEEDLDLFDVKGNPGGPLKDRRFTTAFWAQVYGLAEVFGAVGGRAGSLDVAAFMGLNFFEWDEPLLEEVEGREYDRGWEGARVGTKHLEGQVPQHLRLLTQGSFMSIGLLDRGSFCEGWYARVSEDHLEAWLEGKKVFPSIPVPYLGTKRNLRRLISAQIYHLKTITTQAHQPPTHKAHLHPSHRQNCRLQGTIRSGYSESETTLISTLSRHAAQTEPPESG